MEQDDLCIAFHFFDTSAHRLRGKFCALRQSSFVAETPIQALEQYCTAVLHNDRVPYQGLIAPGRPRAMAVLL
jgi:hypothetical protein